MKGSQATIDDPKLDFIIGTNTSIFEKGAVNPSFKVMEEIYSNGKVNFFDRINHKKDSSPYELKDRPVSLTPIPSHQHRIPSKSIAKKEDIFINPAAFYLSKKPLAFSKQSREAQRQKSLVSPLPSTKVYHKKSNSQQVPSNYTLLSKEPILVPMKEIQQVSPRERPSQSQAAKEVHCEALSQLANYCQDTLKVKTPLIGKQQKVAEKYSKEMDWITDVLQSYGQYKPKIMKELFRYTSDSRDDLEVEREKIVNQIKTGVFDPNKNVIRLRARLKKKKDKGF